MAHVIGQGTDVCERSAAGRRFDDHILLGNIPRFRPDCMDEPSIPAWLNHVGYWLPWEIAEGVLT